MHIKEQQRIYKLKRKKNENNNRSRREKSNHW